MCVAAVRLSFPTHLRCMPIMPRTRIRPGVEMSFHDRFLGLVAEIERRCPVEHWRSADLDLWPLARSGLYLDMYWSTSGSVRPARRPLPLRIAGALSMPLRNRWWTRRD